MRVFLDANFLVAAGYTPKGVFRKILETNDFSFVTSEHLLQEVNRNLVRLSIEPKKYLQFLRQKMEITNQFAALPTGLPLSGDGDRQALAEAIGADCQLFVTSDSDFQALFGTSVSGVKIMKSAIFVRL